MSLRLLAGPSATGLLSTGPGGGCIPQGEAEHQESSPLGRSIASQTLRLGHKRPRPHEADWVGMFLVTLSLLDTQPQCLGKISADREVPGIPKQKAMEKGQPLVLGRG